MLNDELEVVTLDKGQPEICARTRVVLPAMNAYGSPAVASQVRPWEIDFASRWGGKKDPTDGAMVMVPHERGWSYFDCEGQSTVPPPTPSTPKRTPGMVPRASGPVIEDVIMSSPVQGPPPTPPEVAADHLSSRTVSRTNPPTAAAPRNEARAPVCNSSSRTTVGAADPPVPPLGSIDTSRGPMAEEGMPDTQTHSPPGCQAVRTMPAGAPTDDGHRSVAAARGAVRGIGA